MKKGASEKESKECGVGKCQMIRMESLPRKRQLISVASMQQLALAMQMHRLACLYLRCRFDVYSSATRRDGCPFRRWHLVPLYQSKDRAPAHDFDHVISSGTGFVSA